MHSSAPTEFFFEVSWNSFRKLIADHTFYFFWVNIFHITLNKINNSTTRPTENAIYPFDWVQNTNKNIYQKNNNEILVFYQSLRIGNNYTFISSLISLFFSDFGDDFVNIFTIHPEEISIFKKMVSYWLNNAIAVTSKFCFYISYEFLDHSSVKWITSQLIFFSPCAFSLLLLFKLVFKLSKW